MHWKKVAAEMLAIGQIIMGTGAERRIGLPHLLECQTDTRHVDIEVDLDSN